MLLSVDIYGGYMRLKSLVIYTQQLDEMRKFYSALGFELKEEQHGNGPKHYSCKLGGILLEFYPSTTSLGKSLRLELSVKDLQAVRDRFTAEFWLAEGRPFVNEKDLRIIDPDGNKVILTESKSRKK